MWIDILIFCHSILWSFKRLHSVWKLLIGFLTAIPIFKLPEVFPQHITLHYINKQLKCFWLRKSHLLCNSWVAIMPGSIVWFSRISWTSYQLKYLLERVTRSVAMTSFPRCSERTLNYWWESVTRLTQGSLEINEVRSSEAKCHV